MSDSAMAASKPNPFLTRDPASGAPLAPQHPERICWGCNKYCPENALACGNGTIRAPHPIELFGEDWLQWGEERDSRPRQRPP